MRGEDVVDPALLAFPGRVLAARGLEARLQIALELLAAHLQAVEAAAELIDDGSGLVRVQHPTSGAAALLEARSAPGADLLHEEVSAADRRLRVTLRLATPSGDGALLGSLLAVTAGALGGQLLADDLAAASSRAQLEESRIGTIRLRRGRLVECDAGALAILQDAVVVDRLPADVLYSLARRCPDGEARRAELPLGGGRWLQVSALSAGDGDVTLVLRCDQPEEPILEPLPPRSPYLSPRELEVAQLAAQGLGNRGIGHRLGVSPDTVKLHLKNACRKLAVRGRAELAARLANEAALGEPIR